MSGALQAVFQNQRSFGEAPPTVIGQAYGGGFYAGQIGIAGIATHYLVVGPVASAESYKQWKNANTGTTGSDSVIDGPQNTADMVAAGNATVFPAAHFCNDLVIGGFSDWYFPAKNELEICYFNLKPTTASNNTSYGTNTNAVPERTTNYTAGTPAQTSATNFKDTGTEDFSDAFYWTSTEDSDTSVIRQTFGDGFANTSNVTNSFNVRAIRRVAV